MEKPRAVEKHTAGSKTNLMQGPSNHPHPEVLHRLDELSAQMGELNSLLHSVLRAQKPRRDPDFVSWAEAAEMMGLNGSGAARRACDRIRYEKNRAGGLSIRSIRGAVHRRDLQTYLEQQAKKHRGQGAVVRDAIRDM